MKKILCFVLCAVLLCGVLAMPIGAANHCELFQSEIRSLRWSRELGGSGDVAEGDSFSANVIMYHMKSKLMQQYLEPESAYLVIPAAAFERETAKYFAKLDWTTLRAWKEEGDEATGYNDADKTYSYIAAGGMGDSTTYVVQGYTQNGQKYTVYSYFVDRAGDEIEAGWVKGVDYITYNDMDCKVMHRVKNVVETDGKTVKFHSWETVDSIPAADKLIVPGQTVADPTTTTKKPTTTTVAATTTTTTGAPVVVAQIESAKLEAAENVFPENTVVAVEKLEITEELKVVEQAVKKVATSFVAYEITAKSDNVSVQPNGKVKATFTVPASYDMSKVAVVYVAPDGATQEVPSVVDEQNGTVTAELSHFSTYAVVESNGVALNQAPSAAADGDADNSLVLWIVIAVAAVAIIGVGVCFFVLRGKKKA